MAIEVIKEPGLVALAKNPVGIRLQTDNAWAVTGVKATFAVKLTADVVAGQTFQFAWNGNVIPFICSAAPSAGNEFQSNVAGDYMDDWAQVNLWPVLLSNYLLNRDFVVDLVDGSTTEITIRLSSRNEGSEYDITFSHTLTNYQVLLPLPGSNAELRPNFKIYLDLYIEKEYGSNLFTKAVSLASEPAGSEELLIVDFDISSPLRSSLDIDLPAYNQSVISVCANALKQYYYTFAEAYGSPVEVQTLTNNYLNPKLALFGGFAWHKFPGNLFINNYITHTSARKFLTAQPRTKEVHNTQQEYLYLYNEKTTGTITLKLKVYYTDGTSSLLTDALSITALKRQLYIFPAGYTQLAIAALSDKTVDYWEVYTEHTGGNKSETFTYELSGKYTRNNRFYLYQNSLGCFDTLWCNGEEEMSIELAAEEAERIIPFDYSVLDNSALDINITSTDLLQVNTGWKDKEYIMALKDFLLSPNIYEITDSQLVPVKMERKTMKIYSSDDYKYALSFKIQSAYDLDSYSE